MPQKNNGQKQNSQIDSDAGQDKLSEKISSEKKLSHENRRTFAINLGKLAARLNSADPMAAAKQIIETSGLSGKWEKRKRFFRLPNEATPVSTKDGIYNADPLVSLAFAKTAGRLMSRSNREDLVKISINEAVKTLAKGSSFMPSFSPESSADRSVKSLLDEYAARLAEAIQERTEIVKLWESLETSNINLHGYSDDDVDEVEASDFGDAAIFPSELLQPMYRPHVTKGRLTPNNTMNGVDHEWAEPSIKLGVIAVGYHIRFFCVPKERHKLFQDCDLSRISEWLYEIGFDFEKKQFPDLSYDYNGLGWKTFKVSLLLNVCLNVSRGSENEVSVSLGVWPINDPFNRNSTSCLFTSFTHAWPHRLLIVEQHSISSSNSLCFIEEHQEHHLPQPDENGKVLESQDGNYDGYTLDFLTNSLKLSTNKDYLVIMPDLWQENPDYWDNRELGEEYQCIKATKSWSDDPHFAKLLFGDENIRFYPSIPQAEANGGAAREGSIAASLLQNATIASDQNRITKLLIDRVALTAKTGLNFYDAMVQVHREAIRQI